MSVAYRSVIDLPASNPTAETICPKENHSSWISISSSSDFYFTVVSDWPTTRIWGQESSHRFKVNSTFGVLLRIPQRIAKNPETCKIRILIRFFALYRNHNILKTVKLNAIITGMLNGEYKRTFSTSNLNTKRSNWRFQVFLQEHDTENS